MKPFNPRPRPCPVCSNGFVPVRPMQKVCSPRCAARKVKQDKADERAQVRTRREAIKTIPQLIAEAQREFNAFIRERDHDQPCISCGAPPPDLSGLHAGRDAGHYRSVGSARHLRFHEDNCHAQCVRCNQWGAGMVVDYRIGLVRRIGLDAVEALESNNEVKKWTREELTAKRDYYRARVRELRKEKES